MGNIGSQIGNNSHKYNLESPTGVYHQQQLSLPRINQHQQHHHHHHHHQPKVLPAPRERPKLRSTENGKILHSGGTLSGRHQENKIPRGTFLNAKEKVNQLKEAQENRTERLKKSGSEPDLRHRLRQEASKEVDSKKYDDWLVRRRSSQSNKALKRQEAGDCRNTRRVGLFKTRTEKNGSNQGTRSNSELKDGAERLQLIELNLNRSSFVDDKLAKYNVKQQNSSRSDENNVKRYYFGMENPDDNSLDYDIGNYVKSSDISDELLSNISNNLEDSTDLDNSQKIVLKLRPILPKKRLEIPKFSSSLAWKLLYSVGDSDQNTDRGSANEDNEQFSCEERIAPFSPSRLSKSLEFQFSQDKSGDSGISGDETPKPAATWGQYYKDKQSWTPQEDLGDEDTTTDEEDERKFNSVPYYSANSSNKPHIFSLSLPRDHFSNQCALEKYKNQLKRSASGIFSSADEFEAGVVETRAIKNSNWLLSKSAPNSLNNVPLDNGHSSLMVIQSHSNNQQQAGTRRIMYLPSGEEERSYLQMEVGGDGSKKTVEEAKRREQERLKEIEAMQRIEEEFKRKRARHNGLYSNNQHDFRKVLLSAGEKSV